MPLLRARPFGCTQLEALFRHQLLHRSAADVLRLLSILVPVQLLLALFRVPQPDPTLLWLAGSASLGLALALGLACSASSAQHPLVPLCALWLCAHPLALLPWPGLALLPSLMTIFLLYAFFPFPLHWTALLCAFLSMAQLGAMLAVGGPGLGMANVAASLLAQIWVHVVGIYAQLTGRKIGRAVFLNARNALDSDRELQMEVKRMANLLSGSLPPHIVQSVQSQLGGSEVPRVFVEHFGQCSVVFARFYGLPSILAQLQVSDSARLLNEFDWRIRTLAESSGLLLLPSQSSECVLALAGVPEARADHAAVACQFGADLLALVHSFGGATSSQLQLRVGIGSGSLSAGIVGSRRWRYDVLGMAVDAAMHLEGICPAGTVLLSEDTWRQLGGKFTAERLAQGAWQLSVPASEPSSAFGQPLLFPQPPRRFSLLTLQQAVLRLLHQQQPLPRVGQSPAAVAPATPFTKRSASGGKAKGKGLPRMGSCRQLDSLLGPSWPAGLRLFSLHFDDVRLDRAYHAQPDHWLIPGLALCVLFLGLFGLFQALAMPRMLPNLATLGLALGLMFLLLLALYVNFLESFCQFVTRTALGHSVAVLLVLAALCTCGLANTFSCPLEASTASSAICQPVQLPAVSLALWMFLPTLFVRLSSLLSLLVLMAALGLFCLHLFVTHAALYPDLLSRIDLLGALIGLALLLFMLARRNELLLRMDFLALLKSVEDARKIERIEFLNDQILLNALPAHIAFNFAGRADPYAHLCPSVGVLCARLGRSGDWVGEFGFDRLNRLVCEIDQRLGQLSEQRLEKVRTGHCFYTAACGVLPEMAKNVHDAPCTIGEQLASLAQLAEFIQEAAEAECLDVAIGLDCGAALSAVIGGDRPRYELLGQPITRARKLAEAASALGGGCVLLSEDVFLALRPRSQFHFDERSALSVGPGLVAYSLLRSRTQQPQQQQQPKSVEPPPPPPHRANQGGEGGESQRNGNSQPIKATANNNSPTLGPLAAIPLPHIRSNPLADGRLVSSSAQSLCSSELFSVDLSVETDSLELEWVTPEMVANGQYRPYQFHEPASYKGDRAGFYSELSVNQSAGGGGGSQQPFNGFEEDKKRPVRPMTAGKSSRPRNGSRSSANISSFGSELSLPTTAVGTSGQFTLNLAAKKVDRMLKEMAGLQGLDPPVPECPFPRELAQPPHQQQSQPSCSRHGNNNNGTYDSRCLSEYENNDSRRSLANCGGSDSEAGGFGGSFSRLDRLKRALLLGRGAGRTNNISSGNVKGPGSGGAQQPSAKRKAAPDGGTRDGNEADRSCSPSVTSSQILPLNRRSAKAAQLLGMRWRHSSAHSIGYEDEYELTSAPLSSYSSSAVSLGWESKPLPSVGENSLFAPIDAEEALEEADQQKTATNDEDDAAEASLRIQMLELTRDIRRNFGDFQLASFEAESSKAAEVDRRKEEE